MKNIGKYEIIEELGKGAMGIVYKAFDPHINREVAIKTIHFHLVSEDYEKDEVMKRFMREAQAAGKLLHPNIITIYDIGREGDLTYIVMQYIEGQSLQKMIASGKKFSTQKIVQLMTELCSALDYAHKNGVVHRDVKPANILIDKNGKPFIVDFGVVHIEASTLTQEGTTIGTPSYMSPEQVMGKNVDSRSDIFSLGAILYELLTGKKPFGSESITTVIYKIINEEPPSLTKAKEGLPPHFQQVINKALAKEPEKRYQTCAQLVSDLQGFDRLPEEDITFDMAKELETLEKRNKSNVWLVWVLSVFLIGAAIGIGTFYFTKKYKKTPSVSEDVQKVKTEELLLPSLQEAAVPDDISDKINNIEESFKQGNFAETIQLAEQVLSEFENNRTAKEYLEKARSKMNETLISPALIAGIESYKQENFEQCLQEMEKILSLDQENKEAQKYHYLADTAISRAEIRQVIERQREAEEKKDIVSLLRDIGSPALSKQREEDAMLLFNYYDEIKSFAANIEIKIKNRTSAEVNFSYLLSAVYRKSGQRKIVFEGIKTWEMKKQDKTWKIMSIK